MRFTKIVYLLINALHNLKEEFFMTMAGGWSPFNTHLTPDEMQVFNQATAGMVGAKYEPIAVSTQVVNGINYKFFCNSNKATMSSPNEGAIVEIHSDPNQQAKITEIVNV